DAAHARQSPGLPKAHLWAELSNPVEFARAHHDDELCARAVEPDGSDAALLEVDPRAGEVVDDLAEVGLVADDEDAPVAAGGRHQLQRVVAVEAGGERLMVDRLEAQ